jgi:hypothetical protein
VLLYAGGTRTSSCFIPIALKSWSGRKRLVPPTYMITTNVTRSGGEGITNRKTIRIFQKNLKEREGNLAVYVMCNLVWRVVQRIMYSYVFI